MSGRLERHSDVPTLGAARGGERGAGFTLIEVLTAIAVIGILTSIVLVVGAGVLSKQRGRLTQNLLMNLDRVLDEYMLVTSGAPPRYLPDDYEGVPGETNMLNPVYPPGSGKQHAARPDAAVFLKQTRGYEGIDKIVGNIPERFLRLTNESGEAADSVEGDLTPSLVDAWAKPGWLPGETDKPYPIDRQQVVYYVHPDHYNINRFRLESDFYTWLYRIVVNCAISYRKKRNRHRHASIEASDEKSNGWYWTPIDSDSTPETHVSNLELRKQIQSNLETLPLMQRVVFTLKFLQDFKIKEIAQIIGCSEGTVKNYLFRGTQKMRRRLSSYMKL